MIVISSLRSHHLHYYLSRKLKRYMRGIAGISIVTHIRAFRPLDVHSEHGDGQITLHTMNFLRIKMKAIMFTVFSLLFDLTGILQ